MIPAPALRSDLLSALSERRTTPNLKAQEEARGADFGQLLRNKQTDEVSGRRGKSDPGDPSEIAAEQADGHESEEVDESAAVETTDIKSTEGSAEPPADTVAVEGSTAAHGAPKDGDQTVEIASIPLLAEEAERPDQPVTIRVVNAQLLHHARQLELDPRALLSRPAGENGSTVGEQGTAAAKTDAPESSTRSPAATAEPTAPESVTDETGDTDSSAGSRSFAAGTADPSARGAASERPPTAASTPRESAAHTAADRSIDTAVRASNTRVAESSSNPATGWAGGTRLVTPPAERLSAGVQPGPVATPSALGAAGTHGRGAGGSAAEKHGGATSARRESGEPELNRAFTHQVLRGLGAAVAQAQGAKGIGELVLHLQPASLGQLKVRVSFDQARGGLSARFEVASKDAKRLVDGSLAQLRSSLEARGLGVDGLDVRLAVQERPVSDPLGLISGTPYAEGKGGEPGGSVSTRVESHAARGREADASGGETGGERQTFDLADHGQYGPEARTDRGQGSMDAPPSSLFSDDAAAERLVASSMKSSPFVIGRDAGGALRLVVDAIA